MNDNNLIKFLSIIYHPEKYPLPKRKFIKILQGLFQNKYDRKLIYNNFIFSFDYYYINDINGLFTPKEFLKKIFDVFVSCSQTSIIWAFAISYNSFDKKYEFSKKMLEFLAKKNCKTKFIKFLFLEISKLKNHTLYKKNYEQLQNLEQSFETHSLLERMGWELERIINPSLAKLLDLLCIINKNNWYETIRKLDNPFVASTLNLYYRTGKKKKDYKTLSSFLPYQNDNIVALSIFNSFEFICKNNKTVYKCMQNLLCNIKQLNYKRFYWYGIILSNAGYFVHDEEILSEVLKLTKKVLIEELCAVKKKNAAIINLTKGLKTTPRDTSYRHLDICRVIFRKNQSLSIKLMQHIVEDYKNIITKERCYIPDNEDGISYTNNVIYALTELTINNHFNIINFSKELLDKFYLSKEDYLYNFSQMISEKSRVLHVFTTVFYVIENLEKMSYKIDSKEINYLFEKFINYIDIHLKYEDDALINCMDRVFELSISFENNILYKTMDIIINRTIPSFKTLALLINKVPENYKTKEVKNFIENYFDKYSTLWLENQYTHKNLKFRKWYDICIILKDKNRARICVENFPKHEKQKYLDKIEEL